MAGRTATPTLSTEPVRKPSQPARTASNASTKPSPAPSPAPPAPASTAPLPDLSTFLNLPLRLTVAATGELPQREVEGSLFTYDSSFVVLAAPLPTSVSPATAPKRSFHFLKTSQIKAVAVISTTPDPSLPSPSAPLSATSSAPADVSARVEKAVVEDKKARARLGQGVSPEAQALFDALGRTMPVRWAGKSIVVMDEVVVESPYGSENVKGGKGSADRVERIKRVLDGIRSRMGTPVSA
ncbi:hypothetical protein JCM10213_004345 [Rhodosporidiobolus nylandii]